MVTAGGLAEAFPGVAAAGQILAPSRRIPRHAARGIRHRAARAPGLAALRYPPSPVVIPLAPEEQMAQPPGAPGFLAHRDGDLVGVAVRDLDPGPVQGGYLSGPASISVRLTEAVPLGHKLALTDIAAGQEIIEYGQPVGIATRDIRQGDHVHVHNVRSARL